MRLFLFCLLLTQSVYSQSKKSIPKDTVLTGYWVEMSISKMVESKYNTPDSTIIWCFEPDGIFIIEKNGVFLQPLKSFSRVKNKVILSYKEINNYDNNDDDELILEQFDIIKYNKKSMILRRTVSNQTDEKSIFVLEKTLE